MIKYMQKLLETPKLNKETLPTHVTFYNIYNYFILNSSKFSLHSFRCCLLFPELLVQQARHAHLPPQGHWEPANIHQE